MTSELPPALVKELAAVGVVVQQEPQKASYQHLTPFTCKQWKLGQQPPY